MHSVRHGIIMTPMSDIFISYARADKEKAELLANAFSRKGWSVWWDREIPPGKSFDETIENALNSARCCGCSLV